VPTKSKHIQRSIGFQLYKTFQKIREGVLAKFSMAGHDLTFEQTLVLNSLWGESAKTHSEILEEVLQKKGNLTRTLKSLEEKGLIKLEVNPDDARSKFYSPSTKGDELEVPIRKIMFSHLSFCVKGISSEELKITLKVLNQIFINLSKEK